MIIIITFFIIIVCAVIAIVRSEKPVKLIITEAKYEIVYNVIGSRALMDDFFRKNSNQTELPNKSGQIIVITGGARGIGVEVVKMLMQCDMHVIVGCRNVSAGEKLESLARKDGIKTGTLEVHKLDVGSLESVREFGKIISEKYPKINVLINNAGIMFGPYVETADGFESQFAVNYLGHFLLTHLLIPNLKAAGVPAENSRIVNVSSCAHYAGEIDFEDIHSKEQYIASAAYGQSKLAQILFTNYLDAKFKADGIPIQVHSVHPGIVNTELFDGTLLKNMMPFLPGLIFKNPVQGATPIVYAVVSPKLEGKGGTYISNCRITKPKHIAKSVEVQEKLFNMSNKMTDIKEYGKPV